MNDPPRERACPPVAVPDALSARVAGYRWARDLVGEAGAAVYRLHDRADAPDLFLKTGGGAAGDDIAAEAARLDWLCAHLPVPARVAHARLRDTAWLLTAALPGETAWQALCAYPETRAPLVDALARFLARVHAIPAGACPFEAGLTLRLPAARALIDAGDVDTDDFDDTRAGWSAEQVWDALQALLPVRTERVVTHGDYSLDNILVRDGVVTGVIDVGRAGIADPWQDLAIMHDCLAEFGPVLQQRFLATYGIADDPRRREVHLLLDELF